MKSLKNQDDVRSTQKAMEKAQNWFLSIPDQKTPWYLLSLDYADGYVHWYDVGGNGRRIVCSGGLEGKGFAVNECPICAHVMELYQEAKRCADEGDEAKAKALKDRANRLHGKPEVQFKAIRGIRTLLKTPTGKQWVADFDTDDADSAAAVGIISMSESQFSGLTGMIKGEGTDFIQSGDDLGNRVLWTSKESRKGKSSNYSAVVWTADPNESPMPDIEIPEELKDMDLTESFVIDTEAVEKVYAHISGQAIESIESDDPVSAETDSEASAVPESSDLDDLPEDDDPEDDGFVDDEIDEEPVAKPAVKQVSRPAVAQKPAARPVARPASGSGKVRL